jgi:purine-cytosine permease-like protein
VVAFTCLNVIVYHIVRLLRNSSINKDQKRAALFMAMRVFLLCAAVYCHGFYYIVADIYRYKRMDMPFWNAQSAKNENFVGHLLVATWGTLFFLAFGTTTQSRRVVVEVFTGKQSEKGQTV